MQGGVGLGEDGAARRVEWSDEHTPSHGTRGVTAPAADAGAPAILDPHVQGRTCNRGHGEAARFTGARGSGGCAGGALCDSATQKHCTNTVVRPVTQHTRGQGCV